MNIQTYHFILLNADEDLVYKSPTPYYINLEILVPPEVK